MSPVQVNGENALVNVQMTSTEIDQGELIAAEQARPSSSSSHFFKEETDDSTQVAEHLESGGHSIKAQTPPCDESYSPLRHMSFFCLKQSFRYQYNQTPPDSLSLSFSQQTEQPLILYLDGDLNPMQAPSMGHPCGQSTSPTILTT